MIAIDTNVLVRVIVDDPEAEQQCASARNMVAEVDSIWVSAVVLVETSWVLESVYGFTIKGVRSRFWGLLGSPTPSSELFRGKLLG